MKLLEQTFVKNFDRSGDNTFTQVKTVPTPSLNTYIYRRERMDGSFVSYEVFVAKRRYKGDKLPGGLVEAEDRERYPTANDFGFTAKEFKNLSSAESYFDELVEKMQVKEDKKNGVEDKAETFEAQVSAKLDLTPKIRGRKRKERPALVYPTGNQWLMKDLLKANEVGWTQSLAYIELQKALKSGIVVEVARVKNDSGRGRAMVVYKTAKV
jgi:hypothetical protein